MRKTDPVPTGLKRIAAAACAASTIEWYDFFVYGTAAALVFNKVFFPTDNPTLGTLAAFATFGVGFLFRPVGAVLFGHLGDKRGRKQLLIITMLLVAVCATLIGLVPSYGAIGIWAPILLVVLRCVQGVAIGGQFGSAMLIVTENAPPHRRAFYGSFALMGSGIALILSNLVFLALHNSLSDSSFESWGWRIPFLISILVIPFGIYINLHLEDTPEFKKLEERKLSDEDNTPDVRTVATQPSRKRERSPVLEAIRSHPAQIFQVAGMMLAPQVGAYVISVFSISYLGGLGMSTAVILAIGPVFAAAEVVSEPIFGALADRYGRKQVLLPVAVLTLIAVFPIIWLLTTATTAGVFTAAVAGGVILGGLFGPMAALYTEMFDVGVRYSGASIGYQIAAVVGGGFAPFIAESLLVASGTIYTVAAYTAVAAILTIIAIWTTVDRYQPPSRGGNLRVDKPAAQTAPTK